MKFEFKGNTGGGSNHTPANFTDLSWYDNTPFEFQTLMKPVIKNPEPSPRKQLKVLELTWVYFIFFKGKEIFQCKSYSEYYIDEIEIEPTNSDLLTIIQNSHSYLIEMGATYIKQFSIFDPIPPISAEATQQTADQLHSFLLAEL